MKIVFNTRLLIPGKLDGISLFTTETLKRITTEHTEHDFFFIFDRPFSDDYIFSDNIEPVVAAPQSRHPLLWYIWFEHSIPKILRKIGADIFVSPDGYLSLSAPTTSLAVIHDLNFMHYPGYHPFLKREYYRYFFPRFAARADRLATVSEFSAVDIQNTFAVKRDSIDVVYNGASTIYTPVSISEKVRTKLEYTDGKDFFLFAGSFHQRKNVCGLLQAYDSFRVRSESDIKLVLAGEYLYDYPQMRKTLNQMRYRKDVIFTGHMQQSDLRRLYGSSVALVYVSFFEGFGIPVLEAMNCNTPVIASNTTSVPEIAGDAALIVDPYNINSIADAMLQIYLGENIRNSLIEKSAIRRELFSWDRTAGLLWESIEKTLSVKK